MGTRGRPGAGGRGPPETVEGFLAALEHPFRAEILAVRELILSVDPGISEEIKWSAPSFRTTEHFATLQLRAKDGIQVILHRGAKAREPADLAVDDPESLLAWLGPERASVRFRDLADLAARGPAFRAILQQWIRAV